MIDWSKAGSEALGHLKDLLRIDTTNPPGNEIVAAEHLGRALAKDGIEFRIVESEPGRASLIARLRGSAKRGPLLLNGHLDVVTADAARWKHPPFGGVEADGCVWGRGAIDMKNMVAMSLMTMLMLKRERVALDRDVIFAAVADEEAGSRKGATYLVEKHPDLVRADFVLNEVGGHTLHVGKNRFYPIQVSEKGICWFRLTARGKPGHGSMPHAHNAVVRVARAIDALGRVRLPQHNTEVVAEFFRTLARGAPFPQRQLLPLLLQPRLAGHLLDALDKQDPEQAMGLNAMLRNTASPTILSGGKKVNVIPAEASVDVDGRVIPGQSIRDFLAEIQKVVGGDIEIVTFEEHEGSVFPSGTPLYDAICQTLARHDPGAEPVPYMIPGFTDSSAYGRLGAICYGFAPVRLDPHLNFTRMYHGDDERIPVDGFLWGLRVLYDTVSAFCAAA